jgi:hypothetical protein
LSTGSLPKLAVEFSSVPPHAEITMQANACATTNAMRFFCRIIPNPSFVGATFAGQTGFT